MCEPSVLLTQQVQSGLRFLLSDHGQPTPVAREGRHLSIQEGILGADGLFNRKMTTALPELDAQHGFRQLEELLTTVFTFQQSRFQVGFGDVVSVVSVNLNQTRLISATGKDVFDQTEGRAHAQLVIYSSTRTITSEPAVGLTNRSASSQHAPVIRAKMASSQSCW